MCSYDAHEQILNGNIPKEILHPFELHYGEAPTGNLKRHSELSREAAISPMSDLV